MFKRIWMLLAAVLLATIVLSGCGSKDKEKNENNEENNEVVNEPENNIEENDEPEEPEEPEENEENENNNEEDNETASASGSDEFASLISYMEEETEGTANVIYETNEAQEYDLEDMNVSIDGYTIVELKDFHTNYSIPFNDQTDGGVIIAKYTVTNDRDEDAYYSPHFYMSYTGATKAFGPNRDLIPVEEQISEELSHKDNYLIKAGETATGYYAYSFGQDHFEEALEASTVAVEIPAGQGKEDSFDEPIGKDGKITLSLNEDGEARQEGNKDFYNDKVTSEDMGDKEMLKEKNDIGESQDLRDVKVTLDGYQFTEFTPNEVEAGRFSNFTEGVVLLTVKFELDNQGDDNIGLNSLSTKLTVNNGGQWMLNEGMLLDYRNDDIVKAGDSGELLQIFVLDKEQYDKIWQDKDFELEVGPMKDEEAKDISKGNRITFTLPN